VTQHRLLILDVEIRGAIRKKRNVGLFKVKWWNLNGENAIKFSKKIKIEGKWKLEGDSSKIWEEMADCIRRSAREVLGVSNEGSGKMKGAWWWSEEVKGKVEEKQEKYKALVGSRTDEEREINRIQYRMRTRRLREQWQ